MGDRQLFKQVYIINSINRNIIYTGQNSITNFRINLTPHLSNVIEITLESVSLPFNWNNVVPEYGNSLLIVFSSTPHPPVHTIAVTLPTGFYNMDQLLTLINTSCQAYFSVLVGAPAGRICPFTFVLNSVTTHIDITYDDSFYGSSTLTFDTSWTVPTNVIKKPYHVYQMLGLSISTADPLNHFVFPASNVLSFPNSYSNRLPISYILINIEELPAALSTTGGKSAQFYVDVTDVVNNGERITAPVQYRHYRDSYNSVFIKDHMFNLKELNIYLTDSQGLSLDSQNPKEWSMVLSMTRRTPGNHY